jgi:O-acetyl-ADP-ribose deacetylase (regulator of RNase III)
MINYVTGDATAPEVEGNKIIAHVCNDLGRWGRGFVLAVSQRYPVAEWAYRGWHKGNIESIREDPPFRLGEVQLVSAKPNIFIANMISQHGITPENGIQPIRYDALKNCLNTLRIYAQVLQASVHMPRIGCGLAGGKWSEVEQIVNSVLVQNEVKVYVYDFNTGDNKTVPWNK